MKWSDIICESMDRPLPYRWTIRSPRQHEANFEIDGVVYFASMHATRGRLPPSDDLVDPIWIINFGIDREASVRLHGHPYGIMEPTNLRRQFSVLSTVRAIFDSLISEIEPENIWMSALAKSGDAPRRRLYQLFAEHLSLKFGYHFDRAVMDHFVSQGDGAMWFLRK